MADVVRDPQLAEHDEDIPIMDPGGAPPVPPRALLAQQAPVQFLRSPPQLRPENDLDLYLRRFQSYVNSIGARVDEIPHILINCMSDEVMMAVERFLVPNLPYDQLIAILRRELGGTNENRESHKAKLRKTLRSRNENVRAYYVRLYNIAKKAYANNEDFRDLALRDAFINNIQDAGISARLREQANMNNEQLLEHAAMLVTCKSASARQPDQVNAALNADESGQNELQKMSDQLGQLVDLMANNVLTTKPSVNTSQTPVTAPDQNNQQLHDHQGNDYQTYQYQGSRRSVGLPGYQHYNPGNRNPSYHRGQRYSDNFPSNNRNQNNFYRDNYRSHYRQDNRSFDNRPNNRYNAWNNDRAPRYNSDRNQQMPALQGSEQQNYRPRGQYQTNYRPQNRYDNNNRFQSQGASRSGDQRYRPNNNNSGGRPYANYSQNYRGNGQNF